jgi:xanthine/uracil permease
MKSRIAWAFIVGGITAGVLLVWREFFWQHAVLIGLAVTALVYSAFGAVDRLKRLHHRQETGR